IAWGKLNGSIKDFSFKGQQITNLVLFVGILVVSGYLITNIDFTNLYLFYVVLVAALVYGVLFVLPIGGADMPVVISLLNSFTGVAAACGG
ncbi:NAD(P)(+) transhydrogenase (Re/Si-specific) subunit beta, partial [Shewanella algae]|uniref:NAD(P)(+) transhydrogenase (Re/Si-specific) subunit beta n=1 Tax=Shewanella algae TaxID=38313 RepID=UPI00313BD043